MIPLNVAIFVIQLLILKELASSSVWRGKRKTIECLKVMYCTIGLSCIFTMAFAVASGIFGVLDELSGPLRAMLSTLVVVYSFIAHQAVLIYNKRRVKERIKGHAGKRPNTTTAIN